MARYRWDYPIEWLEEKIDSWDEQTLREEFKSIARLLDSDQIQNEFEEDMDRDGYFVDLDKDKNG